MEINNSDMKIVPAKLTKRIISEMEEMIRQGWYSNKSELIRSAVRDLVKKQKITQLESAIKEDVRWGLYSK